MKKININGLSVKYNIYSPGGNVTALVLNNDYDFKIKKMINNYILNKFSFVEQVGFIKNNSLEMAGGEFCINAARCAIYYLYQNDKKLKINILGKELLGKVNKNYVSIKYDINKKIDELVYKINNDYLINLDGISLLFLNKVENNLLLEQINNNIKELIKERIKKINSKSKALGIVLTDKNKIYPFIWVKEIDTFYFESACGSASIAYALLNDDNNIKEYIVRQPSGYDVKIRINKIKNIIKNIEFNGFVEEIKERR
jgi:diaminopimelate epimerase